MAFTEEERKARHRASDKAWRERNPEKFKKQSRKKSIKYYYAHREQCIKAATAARKANPEYQKEWWKNNREKAKGYRKKRRKQRTKENREWRKENPGKTTVHKHNRRVRETGAGGRFTPEEWYALCLAAEFKCLRCGLVKKLTPDHVVPVSKGGTGFIRNIQPLCGPCNSSKHAKTIDFRIKGV